VPDEVAFATKTQIALEQLRRLLGQSAPRHWVLADVDYGVDTASVRHFATWDSFRLKLRPAEQQALQEAARIAEFPTSR